MNRPYALSLCLLLGAAPVGSAVASCEVDSVRQALPVRDTALAPPSSELAGAPQHPGFMPSVFTPSSSEALSLERVLLRQRLANCVVDEFAGYQARTEFDNTPWRFEAGGEGRKFDSDEFDAWMKKRGVRIARGKDQPAEPAAVAVPATAVEPVPVASPAAVAK